MQGSSSEDAAGYLVRTLMHAYSTRPIRSPTYNFAWRSAPACVGPLHRGSAPPEPRRPSHQAAGAPKTHHARP
jgi:hypothetical protein